MQLQNIAYQIVLIMVEKLVGLKKLIIRKIECSLDIEIGQITRPIKYPNGFLILKVNDKREMKKNKY